MPGSKGMAFLQTAQENMNFYTPQQKERAKQARKLLEICGTAVRDLKTVVLSNQICNNPITNKDITLAESMFGRDLGYLKGRTTRRKPLPILADTIEIPLTLQKKESNWNHGQIYPR